MKQTIIVTGAAKRIGAAILAHLARAGHHVVLHYHQSEQAALALADELRERGAAVETIFADLARPGAAAALVLAASERAGGVITGLVNCASHFGLDTPDAMSRSLFDHAVQANLLAPVELTTALARQPGLTHGSVVNLLDQKLANLNPDFFSYTLSKSALEAATTMLAQSLAPLVRVNAVSPGITLASHDQTAEEFAAVARENLLGQPVAIGDIARAVEFLLTTPSVTGQNIFVDCGQRFVTRSRDVMFATRPQSGANG